MELGVLANSDPSLLKRGLWIQVYDNVNIKRLNINILSRTVSLKDVLL